MDAELTVPVHTPIKLVMTSRDVIHSFYVPAFRMKHDVVPGHYYTAWFEAKTAGTFPIECAEYCGTSHSRMLGTVRVLEPDDYRRWLEDHPRPTAEGSEGAGATAGGDLAATGREVASRRACFNCHTLDGQPHIGPTWAGLFGSRVKLADGRTVVADEAYLTRSMMEPQEEVVDGFKPVMPSYRGLLQAPEVGALVEFMRSIRDERVRPRGRASRRSSRKGPRRTPGAEADDDDRRGPRPAPPRPGTPRLPRESCTSTSRTRSGPGR